MKVASGGRILIIGAGPCGLACARELDRLGHRNWLILERSAHAGGLAASVVDPAGFTWDLGGHVVFSHFGEFDALLDEVLGDEVIRHERSSYVRFGDRWIPYPFQNNLRHLPAGVRDQCLEGLAGAGAGAACGGSGTDFGAWMRTVFGDGITRHFMHPYNVKVWSTPPSEMSADWIGERVSVIDYERAARNVRENRDDAGWGPNDKFSFPAAGGTGEIYRRLAGRLGERVRYDSTVCQVDADARRAELAGGGAEAYDALVSTMPLDRLVGMLADCPTSVRAAAAGLRHSSVFMVGVGYHAPLCDGTSWMYFPQADVPFYRVTNFAKYAAANVPGGDTGAYCSFMTETSYTGPADDELREGLEARVESGLRAAGVVSGRPEVASVHVEDIDYAYPVPTLGRNQALSAMQPWLMARGIFSRGRFGAWRYEQGNMDHAVKMGIDAARAIVAGDREELWAGRSAPPSRPRPPHAG